jgi:hypothetical protein
MQGWLCALAYSCHLRSVYLLSLRHGLFRRAVTYLYDETRMPYGNTRASFNATCFINAVSILS